MDAGCPMKANLTPNTREWKVARLYAVFGGKMYGVLQTESVENVYKRMFSKRRHVKVKKQKI